MLLWESEWPRGPRSKCQWPSSSGNPPSHPAAHPERGARGGEQIPRLGQAVRGRALCGPWLLALPPRLAARGVQASHQPV